MRIGTVFPQTEIGNDPVAIRDFAQAAEALGYAHLRLYEHVLGVDPDRHGGWTGPSTKDTPFHEPFVTLGFLAAHTTTLELVTGVIILPQRQTALVAKQAAEVDILSGGRLRLGVGTGWNAVEYEALNEDFHTRGQRQEEQVALLRELWANETVEFNGSWHRVEGAGINPRPSHRIPIWFGGRAEAVLRRAARMGDGWMPTGATEAVREDIHRLRTYLRKYERDPASFGIDPQVPEPGGDPARWRRDLRAWGETGATHISVQTMGGGYQIGEHIAAIRRYMEAVRDAGES